MNTTFFILLSFFLAGLGGTGTAPLVFSPSDGGGTAAVEPSGEFPVGTRGSWTITFTVGKKGIATGGGLVLQVSPFWGWSQPQILHPDYPGYVTAKVARGAAALELLDAAHYAILVRVKKGHLVKGDRVVITYGDTLGGRHPRAAAQIDRYSERDTAFHIKVDGNADGYFKEIDRSPVISVIAGPVSRLSAVASSLVPTGGKGDVALAALDNRNNRVRAYTGTITLSSVPKGLKLPPKCSLSPGDNGAKRLPFTASDPGVYRIKAVDEAGNLETMSNPIEIAAASPEYGLYWADPHGHSIFSDGTAQPDEFYSYGRDVARLDVLALTDHDAWGIRPLDENPAMWRELEKTANDFYRPGSLVTFVGYEWTNWEYGHMHVLYKGDRGPLLSTRSDKCDTPAKLWASLPEGKAITIPHHSGGGPIHTDWSYYNPAFEPLVEICSVHGISERFGGPLSIYHPVEGSFVQDALRKGYRLGFLGGGDSHTGHPGLPYVDAPSFGISGVWAKELTREAIWEAFLARRTYATTGDRIILLFSINGAMMGEEIKARAPLAVSAEAIPCAPVKSFELVYNNRAIHRADGAKMSYTHRERVSAGDYFYVRLIQQNGQQAFSSPIWIKGKSQ